MTAVDGAAIVDAVRTDGWTVVAGVLDPGNVDEARNRLDALFTAEDDIAAERGWLTDRYRTSYALVAKDPFFIDVATDRRVSAIARSVLGEDVVLAAANGIDLVAYGNAQALHRDHPDPVDSDPVYVHVVVALDDFTAANGATRIVSGSHRGAWRSGDPLPGPVRHAEVGAGGAVVFDGCVVHGAGANRTDSPRRGLHLFYARWWAQPHWDLPASIPEQIAEGLDVEQRRVLGYERRPRRYDPVARRVVR